MSEMSTGPDPAAEEITVPQEWARWLAHTQQVLASVDPANHATLQVAHLDVAMALEADAHPHAAGVPSRLWRLELPEWLGEVLTAAAAYHRHQSRIVARLELEEVDRTASRSRDRRRDQRDDA